MSKSCPGDLRVPVNHAANVHRQIKPFVRIQCDGIRLLHTREQFSRRVPEHSERTVTSIHMHPKLEAVGNPSNLA
jgi:hypothetical protein